MRIVDAAPNRCQVVWITDFLPREISGNLTPLIEHGGKALKSNLEGAGPQRNTNESRLTAEDTLSRRRAERLPQARRPGIDAYQLPTTVLTAKCCTCTLLR